MSDELSGRKEAARKRQEELEAKKREIEEAKERAEREMAARKAALKAQEEAEAEKMKKRAEAMKAAMQKAREEAEGKTYVVQAGDSLSKIAKEELGDGSRWPEIYELNKEIIGDNPNLIKPGQELKLPK